MKTYIKFIIKIFFNSFLYVFCIMTALVIILNVLSEIEFFKNYDVNSVIPIYVALLNSPSLIFEMFPFIFLISTQVFFVYFFNNNEIYIFKYSGLKNSKIIIILSIFTFFLGILIITFFYTTSSNLQNLHIKIKGKYNSDESHLAVITKNGLWIKDKIDQKTRIINASKIDGNLLQNVFITEFDEEYKVIRNIKSEKIDITNKEWRILFPKIYEDNKLRELNLIKVNSNFDYKKIQNLFSNLSSLSLNKLIQLRKNYKQLNYSIVEIDIQINKIITYPIYYVLMTIFSSIIMFNTKKYKSTAFKIIIGLFFSVVIYYFFNFLYILGNVEKISIIFSIWVPLIALTIVNFSLLYKLNEK